MSDQNNCAIEVKKPIKVLHFSDGDMEIFEDDGKPAPPKDPEPEVNEVSRRSLFITILLAYRH